MAQNMSKEEYTKVTEEQFQKYARNKIKDTVRQQSKAYQNDLQQENCECKSFKGRTQCE